MTRLLDSGRQKSSRRAARLLCAAATGVAVELAVAGTSRALEQPNITVCSVIESEAWYAYTYLDDYDGKPEFYVEWSNGGDYGDDVLFYFFQGIGVTTLGSNCWQVCWDPYYVDGPPGYSRTDFWTKPLWCDPNNTSITFFPWQVTDGDYVDLQDFDSDDPTIYEIGVEASDGTNTSWEWMGVTYDT
jgi:hypothetical protein